MREESAELSLSNAVGSGKCVVGKSIVKVNLALKLQQIGSRVGIVGSVGIVENNRTFTCLHYSDKMSL